MKKTLMFASALGAWLQASAASAQFGQNAAPQLTPPAGGKFLPRSTTGKPGTAEFSPFANGGNPYANSAFNTANNPFGYNNIYGPLNPYYSGLNNWPYATPWNGNPFGPAAGFNNNFNGPMTYFNNFNNAYGNNFMGAASPFGMSPFYGNNNYAPIVGTNYGWGPFQQAYNPYNPVNQALTNLYLQGLPNINNLPGNAVLPRGP